MFYFVFAAFIIVPIVEIALLLQVGSLIGVIPTIAIVMLTAALGTLLLRAQSIGVLRDAQRSITEGREPVGVIRDGVAIMLAGALLLTPGFVTDTIGLLLFVPPIRAWLGRIVVAWLAKRVQFASFSTSGRSRPDKAWGPPPGQTARPSKAPGANTGPGTASKVIDGDYHDVTDQKPPQREN